MHVYTGEEGTDLLWSLSAFLLFGSKFTWLYNISDAHAKSRGHISSNLFFTHCTRTWLFLACCSLRGISTGDTIVQFFILIKEVKVWG